jgi:protein tyrosine phosphatase (PTP) superfamily phosphohydrolase (DUF442 family)
MKAVNGLRILVQRLKRQGLVVTAWWAADHAVRILTGAPIARVSRITPHLHVGGQYRRRGWPRLAARGVSAVVNMRIEFDDEAAGIAPPNYLHIPVVDDHAPSFEQLELGAAFITEQIANGGVVYVHCGSGIGRAATMAAAYFVTKGADAHEAWARVRQARPFIRPTAVQIRRLERFAKLSGEPVGS